VKAYVHRIGHTGRIGESTSFYDPEQDIPIASDIVKILMDAAQPIPDFLDGNDSIVEQHKDIAKFLGGASILFLEKSEKTNQTRNEKRKAENDSNSK
jgi:superfamily II DNA/RNA helicase